MIAEEKSAFPVIDKKIVETLQRFRILDNHSSGEAMMSSSLYMRLNLTEILLTLWLSSLHSFEVALGIEWKPRIMLKEYESNF